MTSNSPAHRDATTIVAAPRRPTFARALVMSLVAFSGMLGVVALVAAATVA